MGCASSGEKKMPIDPNAGQARDLKNPNKVGKSDPYVVVEVCGEKAKTNVDSSGNKDPVWNSDHLFNVPRTATIELMTLRIMDKDIGKDDFVGESTIPVNIFMTGQVVDQWFPVTRKGKDYGMIRLQGQWRGAAQMQQAPMVQPQMQMQPQMMMPQMMPHMQMNPGMMVAQQPMYHAGQVPMGYNPYGR